MGNNNRNSLSKELDVASDAARQAGRVLLAHYKQALTITWKGPGNPVTSADQEASASLVEMLTEEFPEDGVLSEEGGSANLPSYSRLWIIDPLDGTQEFIEHYPEFSVMIGLVILGYPVLGVVYQPVTDKLFYAVRGEGAFLRKGLLEIALQVARVANPSQMSIARSRSHHNTELDHVCERIGIVRSVVSGSVGLKVARICEGHAHLYIHTGCKTSLWDTCAPGVILEEAGGKMTDCMGAPLCYNPEELRNMRGVLGSNGFIHDRIVDAIAESQIIIGH